MYCGICASREYIFKQTGVEIVTLELFFLFEHDRSPSLGARNSHTKPLSRHFLKTGLFLGFFSREIVQLRSA